MSLIPAALAAAPWPQPKWMVLTRADESYFGAEFERLWLPWRATKTTQWTGGEHPREIALNELADWSWLDLPEATFLRKVDLSQPSPLWWARRLCGCQDASGGWGKHKELRREPATSRARGSMPPVGACWNGAGDLARVMSRMEVINHFASSRVEELPSFRALCNALKALGIAAAVKALRLRRKGRMFICDVGCGKGGDVGKWMPHRPKKLLGLDGSSSCIAEARGRHCNLVSNGRGCMDASFEAMDLCSREGGHLPVASGEADIVCSHFFLQFAAAEQNVFERVISECARVLAPGGVFLCLVPDGDRILSLLRGEEVCPCFGHFHLRKCVAVDYGADAAAFGMAYCFSLGNEGCTEYVLLPALLEERLREAGFEGALPGGKISLPAQDFFLAHPEWDGIVSGITKGQSASHTDWLTLGLFRVFVASKSTPAEEIPREAEEPPPAPAKAPKRARKRRDTNAVRKS